MDLQDTLEQYVLQLKNTARTLEAVARVCQKIMATLYDTYFLGNIRELKYCVSGPISQCPDKRHSHDCMAFGTDRKA